MEPEKSPSLQSRIVSRLQGLRHILAASLASAWDWFFAKLASSKTRLITNYKAIRKRAQSPRNNKEQHKERQNPNGTDLTLQQANHPRGKEERQDDNDENNHFSGQPRRAFIVRLLRFFWRRRKGYISSKAIEILLAAAIAIAAWTQANIYWQQSETMKNALNETRNANVLTGAQVIISNRTASIAEQTLHEMRQSSIDAKNEFLLTQRPKISIYRFSLEDLTTSAALTAPIPQMPIKAIVSYRNIGRSEALGVHSHCHMMFGNQLNGIKEEAPDKMDVSGGGLESGITMDCPVVSIKNPYSKERVSDIEPEDVINWDGNDRIVVFGRVTYSDQFGGQYCSPYMVLLYPNGRWQKINSIEKPFLSQQQLCPKNTKR